MDDSSKYKTLRLPQIEKDLKLLRKKSPSADVDLLYAERLLQSGQILPQTDPYPGFGDPHSMFKTRIINTSTDKGKSSGYRLIYEQSIQDNEAVIILFLFYTKATIKEETKVRAEIRERLRSLEYLDL